MEKTYTQIVQEIQSLQQQAQEVRQREVQDVINRMKEAIQVYGLTANDLGFEIKPAPAKRGRKPGTKVARKNGAAAKTKKPKRAAAYADGKGNVWSGRGPRPRWLKEALASGRALEEFSAKAVK
jgi:DNA-binding protein H-NS